MAPTSGAGDARAQYNRKACVVSLDENPGADSCPRACALAPRRTVRFRNRRDELPGVWVLGDIADDDRKRRNGSSRNRSSGIAPALDGSDHLTLNGEVFSMNASRFAAGQRYRLKFRNASDDIHVLHLHRYSFELVRFGGRPTAGILKDVVMLGGFQEIEFDFVAAIPGRTLFHCHQQQHMDFGFMALFDYA
jgi:FtsP/CotA-like multicopper oxidase with cupredoxin domain